MADVTITAGTVSHALSATTPDDPTAEIQPQHWNSRHAASVILAAANAIGLFGNANGMSFGTSNNGGVTEITGSYTVPNVPAQTNQTLGGYALGNTFGESSSSTWDARTLSMRGSDNVSLGWSNGSLVFKAAAGGGGNFSAGVSGGNTSGDTGVSGTRVVFAGGNNITLSQATDANGASITVSGANTVAQSNQSVGLYAVGNTTQNSSTTLDARTLSFRGNQDITVGYSNGSVQLSVNVTGAQSAQSAVRGVGVSNVGNTAGNTGVNTAVDIIMAGSGSITLSQATAAGARTIHFQHPAWITTARASTDAIGLNTAQSNVTWTVNSSGLSLDARGYAGTATTFNGANISGSITQNSAGLQLSMSVAAPGAAAEQNAINLLGANTAGNTTATGSTIGWSGINLTLSGTNDSQIKISAPATSSLVGTNGVAISSNGSTISVQPTPVSQWSLFGAEISAAASAQANSLVSIQPFQIYWPVAFSDVRCAASINVGTAANNSSAYVDLTVSGVFYTRDQSTLNSIASFSNTMTMTYSSNNTGTVTGVVGITGTLNGTTLTPGDYWLALHVSTNNTATGGANTTALGKTLSMVLHGLHHAASAQILLKQWGAQTNASQNLISGQGIISTGATRASLAFSDIVQTGTRAVLAGAYFGLRNNTFQG